MTSSAHDRNDLKRAVNVSISASLAAKAKTLEINFSKALETRLAELVATAERRQWLAENAEAIEAYNERVSQGTILSDHEHPF